MGNTHGKKYYESVKTENQSHETLKMLLDIANKGREEKNLVQYGKKTKIQGNDNKDIPMAFHHIISANLLKEFIYKLSYDALNHQDKGKANQSLELLNKIMFKSVVKYCQDYEYFFGFRLDEKGNYIDKGWKLINFLTPVVNDIKKEMKKNQTIVENEVLLTRESSNTTLSHINLEEKSMKEKLEFSVQAFLKIINGDEFKDKEFAKYLDNYQGLAEYEGKWQNFKDLNLDTQKSLFEVLNNNFFCPNNVQDSKRIEFVKELKNCKIKDLFNKKSDNLPKSDKQAKDNNKKNTIKNQVTQIDEKKISDLKSSFEVNAKYIIGNEKYNEINKMKDLMIQYLQSSTLDNEFYKLFSKVIEHGYQKFNEQDWQFIDVINQKSEKQTQAKKNNASKNDDEVLLNDAKELTKDWSSEDFSNLLLSDENQNIGNNFLSQIDAFANDFIEKHGCELGDNPIDAIVKNISSSLLSIFVWLPYNIFEGPRDRIDDPSNKNFKNSGWKIIQDCISKAKEVRNIDDISMPQNVDTNPLKEVENISTPIKEFANVNNPQTPEVKKRDFSRILNSDSKTQQKTKKFDNENFATPTKSTFNTPTKLKFNDENSESKSLKIKSFSKFISNSDSKDSRRQYGFESETPSNKIRVKFDSLFSRKNSPVKNH